MARRKKTDTNDTVDTQQTEQPVEVDENFMKQFAVAMNTVWGNISMFNPYWQNQILKDYNIDYAKFDRDKIKKITADPKNHEKELWEVSQFLFNTVTQYRRLITYFAEILSWDWMLIPTNADDEDKASKQFKKSHKKATDYLDKFDLKIEFPKILESMLMNDVHYTYIRESENSVRFQELPRNYCMITGLDDFGYTYSFDLTYFLRPGVSFDDFDPIFKDYFNEFISGEEYQKKKSGYENRTYYYWVKLDPSKARAFKFNQLHSAITPAFMGLFLDAMEIINYKELLRVKTSVDVYKLLVNKIPMQKDGTGKSRKDDFAVTAQTAATFTQIMNSKLPDGIVAITSPLETEAIDFSQSEQKNIIVGLGDQEFWTTSGTPNVLFGQNPSNGAALQASLKTDEMFVKSVYGQFEKFLNYLLKQKTGRYRFKIKFIGTRLDQQERFDRAMQSVAVGAPISLLATSFGLTPHEFMNLVNMERSFEWSSKLVPLQTAHTLSGKDGGRPAMSDSQIGDAGQKTRDNGSNNNDGLT